MMKITLKAKFDSRLWVEHLYSEPTTQLKLFDHCWNSWIDANPSVDVTKLELSKTLPHIHYVKSMPVCIGKDHVYHHLPELARWLRTQHWAAYHFVQQQCEVIVDHPFPGINYQPQGLVFGRYCARLTEWLLTHT
jgi:hypothetical protein